MFNLNDIMRSAQNGEASANLAQQFGLSPQQAQDAMSAAMTGLSHGLQQQAASGGLGSILSHLVNPANQSAYESPAAAQSPAAAAAGGAALDQMFGSGVAQQIAQSIARQTGLNAALVAQMLPVIVSMTMGGLFKSAANQGYGGMFGQLAGHGGLGDIFGRMLNPSAAPQTAGASPSTGGGLGDIFSHVVGGMLGGGMLGGAGLGGASPGGASASNPGATPPGGLDPASVQAGVDALTRMFQHGAAPSPAQRDLEAEMGDILNGRRST